MFDSLWNGVRRDRSSMRREIRDALGSQRRIVVHRSTWQRARRKILAARALGKARAVLWF